MTDLDRVFRAEFGAVVASLARRFGDLDIAEEAASEAILIAVERWPATGVPPNPGGWLTTTAARKALDRLRREAKRTTKHAEALMLDDPSAPASPGPIEDDRLRLIFTCCHPALSAEAQVALTLRLLGGLSVADIARAFLVSETTMAQRITRAKAKIRHAGIPYRIPAADDLPQRVAAVTAVVYLIYNEGYLPGSGELPLRDELSGEAVRLGRLLHDLLPDEGEVTGLLALMLLTESRRASRLSSAGEIVPLSDQDRGGWDRTLIAEGHALVRECLAANRPGPYQVMAAINAVHTDAATVATTDWGQIASLYDQLHSLTPTPVVALNRAVVVAELDGAEVALAIVDALELDGYHAWHVTRAEMLRRLGRSAQARDAYDAALGSTANRAERIHLERRRSSLVVDPRPRHPDVGPPDDAS